MAKQEITGKAFEYACLRALYDKYAPILDVRIKSDSNYQNAKKAYELLSLTEQNDYALAAKKGIEIISPLEPNLEYPDISEPLDLAIQPDKQGEKGDVRDVLCIRNEKGWNIGLSCKHDHEAVKHSRLSKTIDFGKDWLGVSVSEEYRKEINPLFDDLEELKKLKANWEDVEKKEERFYKTLLTAFLKEMRRIYEKEPKEVAENLLRYLLGRYDFYKIIAHTKDKTTEVKPFNIYGSLGLSTKDKKPQYKLTLLKLPTQILSMDFKKDSMNTVLIHCDNGWALSLRIHSAKKTVEPSLKFDIQLVGVPVNMGTRIEPW